MDFNAKAYGKVTVITVSLARATLQNAIPFKDFVLKQLAEDKRNIVVDLSACEYLDSTFLGALVSSLKKTVASGGDLKLVYSSELSSLIFEMTSMNKVFEAHKDLDEAIASFNFRDGSNDAKGLNWQ